MFAIPFTSCTGQEFMSTYIRLHAFQTADLFTYFYNCGAKFQIFRGLFRKPNHILFLRTLHPLSLYPLLLFVPHAFHQFGIPLIPLVPSFPSLFPPLFPVLFSALSFSHLLHRPSPSSLSLSLSVFSPSHRVFLNPDPTSLCCPLGLSGFMLLDLLGGGGGGDRLLFPWVWVMLLSVMLLISIAVSFADILG